METLHSQYHRSLYHLINPSWRLPLFAVMVRRDEEIWSDKLTCMRWNLYRTGGQVNDILESSNQ
jgi:hypothetical protein